MSVNYTLVLEVRKMNFQKIWFQPGGHSTTTWTDFFSFFDPLPPHLVHVVIEFPQDKFFYKDFEIKFIPFT